MGKFRHGWEISAMGIGKRPEKIEIWWEIFSGEGKHLPMHVIFSTAAPSV
jgi:hypothetical protein